MPTVYSGYSLKNLARSASVLLSILLLGPLPALAQVTAAGALIPSFKDYPAAAVMASLLFVIVIIMMLYMIMTITNSREAMTAAAG